MLKINVFVLLLILSFNGCSNYKKIKVNTEYDFLYNLEKATLEGDNIHPEWACIKDPLKGELTYWGIFEHAPGNILFKDVYIGENAILDFNVGILQDAWDKTGDGVLFEIWVFLPGGEKTNIYSRYVDPKNRLDDRQWKSERISIDEIKNSTVSFSFQTHPGKRKNCNDTSFDWAVWGAPILRSSGRFIDYSTNNDTLNVILITFDTCRADYLGCYGNQWIHTPNIDRLANEGVLFENLCAASSTTAPSHVSIFTSFQPNLHGVINNGWKMPDSLPRLSQYLLEQGYKTGASVSVHYLIDQYSGLGKYFDWFDYRNIKWMKKFGKDLPYVSRGGRETTSAAIDWLEKIKENPYFLWIHYYDSHAPYFAEGEFHKMYYSGDPRSPDKHSMETAIYQNEKMKYPESLKWIQSFRDLDYFKKEYGAEMSFVDSQIGRLLSALERLDLADNTLIVLTGDHGENLGDHEIYFDHWTLYNTDLHVPLIFWYPRKLPSGKRISTPVTHIDITPTILDLVGGITDKSASEMFDGKSLKPFLDRKDIKENRILTADGLLYTEMAGWDGRYKVIWEIRDAVYHDRRDLRMDRVWLFDQNNDSGEVNPIGCFYWGEEEARVLFRQKLKVEIESIQGKDLEEKENLQLERKLILTKEWACQKNVPSIDELRKLLLDGAHNVKLSLDYLNDMEFLPSIQSIMEKMKKGMCPAQLEERLKNVIDVSLFKEGQLESVSVTDEELMRSLGYGGNK